MNVKDHAFVDMFTIDVQHAKNNKEADAELKQLKKNKNTSVVATAIHDIELAMHNNKIFVPKACRRALLDWYHENLHHRGETSMIETSQGNLNWPKLHQDVKKVIKHC